MEIEGRISQANGRLKAANVGVAIQNIGGRLYLRATFPPRPDSDREQPYQQRLALGYHANPAGLKLAEQEARKVGALLDCGEFDWQPYVKSHAQPSLLVGDWVERFEQDYFTRRSRTTQSETTWRHDYLKVFKTLDSEQSLTLELMREAIVSTAPDTRTRKRYVDVLSRLAKFAGIDADFKQLKGCYSAKATEPRDIPSDALIAEWREKIPNPDWRWAYGMMATYGLRNHELFYLDFSKLPVLLVLDGSKTNFHRVYPLYPEWVKQWDLTEVKLPQCTGKTNSDLGNRVSHAFTRYGVPFSPYDLRHAWAIRSLMFGMPVELAAQQMGHSVDVHCKTYHRWINEDVHQRAFELILMRIDRPQPPII